MSDVPFGFSNSDDDPDRRRGHGGEPGGSGDPGAGMPFGFGGASGGFDPAALGQMLTQFGQMLSNAGSSMGSGGRQGPVNYELAKSLAHQQLGSVPQVTAERERAIADAVRLSEMWLDPMTTLPAGATVTKAWTASDWLDATMPTWQRLCDPVAEQMSTMWVQGMPEEARQMAGPMMGMISQMGGFAFGSQLGQALASLSKEVLTSTDIGLPLGPDGTAALLPTAVHEFSDGLDQPERDVLIFLAAREAAHHRLYSHVPWLRQRLLSAVEEYARGIKIDFSAIEDLAKDIDPSALTDPAQLEKIMQQGAFEPQTTPEQKRALERLETMLALIEGWVATVVEEALGERVPAVAALSETLRRRRATGGPAEQTFATLVGLELRPRKVREATAFWARLTESCGIEKRDGVWAHPDLLPDASDLDDSAGFIDHILGGSTSALDDPLAELLRTEALEQREREERESGSDKPGSDEPGGDEPGGDERRDPGAEGGH